MLLRLLKAAHLHLWGTVHETQGWNYMECRCGQRRAAQKNGRPEPVNNYWLHHQPTPALPAVKPPESPEEKARKLIRRRQLERTRVETETALALAVEAENETEATHWVARLDEVRADLESIRRPEPTAGPDTSVPMWRP